MHDALNQNQVEALMTAVSDGSVPVEAPPSKVFCLDRGQEGCPAISTYDFKRPERISKDQIRSLKTLHEPFARNVGSQWTGLLRTIVEIEIGRVEQMTYAEYTAGLADPTCFGLVRPDSLEGSVCLELSPDIFYSMIDRLMGGDASAPRIPGRPLTQIEERLARSVLHRAMSPLSDAWSTICPVQFALGDIESNPQIAQIVPPNEVVIAFEFNVQMVGKVDRMSLCVPFNVIEPLMDELGRRAWTFSGADGRNHLHVDQLSRHIADTGVEVNATLAETTMTLSDLQGLEVGDLILTGRQSESPVTILVEGRPKYLASLGQHQGSRVVRVLRSIRSGERT
ncbi:MAG: flagellar motor switch protein FliM [Planctomycetota bacterium]|nr:flagellar motor switch protein FliM [Planctomycetota bacterium]